MISVLHVISSPAAGGAEVYVKDLSKKIVGLGGKAFIAFLCKAEDIGRCKKFEEEFLFELEEAGVKWFFLGQECRGKPWLGVLRVRRYVKENKINVYHSHLPYGVIFGVGLNVPVVYTHHSVKPRMSRLGYFIFNRIIDQYIGISKVCSESLAAYSGKNVATIMNATDLRKFPERMLPIPHRPDFISAIVVCRIHPHKGLFFLGNVIASLPSTVKDKIIIHIAGEGEDCFKRQLSGFYESLGVAENFNFLGNCSDVSALLRRSDIFLMSSEQEGLPISLIESAASGLPCIVTDVGGCKEVLEICRNGVAVQFNDVEAYAAALVDVVTRPELLRDWSNNARAGAIKLDIVTAARSHLDLYMDLMGGA